MASHVDTKLERNTTGKQQGARKVVAPVPQTIPSTLDSAVQDQRTPTTTELLDECKVVIGRVLIGLRGSDNMYKCATAIQNLVRSIAAIKTVETVEEINEEALRAMSDQELKEYASKLIDKLN